MRLLDWRATAAYVLCLTAGASVAAQTQSPAATNPDALQASQTTSAPTTPAAQGGATTQVQASSKKTYTVPAGTKVLLQLRSSVNTKSARAGDGVYLASTFPVVVGNKVMIPAGVYVQGRVDRVVRAGREATTEPSIVYRYFSYGADSGTHSRAKRSARRVAQSQSTRRRT